MLLDSRAASMIPRSVLLMTGLGPPLWATTRFFAALMLDTIFQTEDKPMKNDDSSVRYIALQCGQMLCNSSDALRKLDSELRNPALPPALARR